MEAGVVLDIFRCSLHDGPGVRTTVFLKGCPLSCIWCHNPESQDRAPVLSFNQGRCTACGACVAACPEGCHRVADGMHVVYRSNCKACGKCVDACLAQALEIKGRQMSVEQVMAEVVKDVDFYRATGGGLTISGGEPMLQFAFTRALAEHAKDAGIHVALETCGLAPAERYRELLTTVDLFLYDYKGTDRQEHVRNTGAGNELIVDNLEKLYAAGARIILRCPLVPGVNDSDAHLRAIADLGRRYPDLVGIDIMPYHNMGNEKGRRVGMPVRLDVPSADAAAKGEWERRLRNYGCTVTIG